jgi:hypothetical protein
MAIYKLQPSVDQPRGSTEGITFQKSGTSFAIRNRSKPILKKTPIQTHYRNQFGHVVQRYRFLTSMDKATFASESPNYPRTDSLGNSYDLSAFNLFNSSNISLLTSELSEIDSIGSPFVFTPITFEGFQYGVNFNLIVYTFSPEVVPAGEVRLYYFSPIVDAGVTSPNGLIFKLVDTKYEGDDSSTQSGTLYDQAWPGQDKTIGRYIWGTVVGISVDTGQVGYTETRRGLLVNF